MAISRAEKCPDIEIVMSTISKRQERKLMRNAELRIVLPWNLMLDMAMERIRQGDKPLKAVESADKAFRRLDELAVRYESALSEGPQE